MKRSIFLVATAALGFCGWMLWFAVSPIELPSATVEFSIRPGSALRGATRQMTEAGIPVSDWRFQLLARAYGESLRIKAGTYEVSAGATPLSLLRKITGGEYAKSGIVFVEGWTFRQMRDAINAHSGLKHDTAELSDSQIMEKLGASDSFAEGMFFPDTYVFAKGSSDIALLAHAFRAMQKQLATAWSGRRPGLPLGDPYEALILASIVEKETGRESDRALIAAVFMNRLKRGMKLQTDPTVIYGLGDQFDGNLRRRHLEADTPFNTYTRRGLPPHPIAMPGRASIAAVMHPAESDALYFVSRGDGTSEFSRTLDEHNRAVARYQMPGARRQSKP